MSVRRTARATQTVAAADADALMSMESPVWSSATSTLLWLDERELSTSRTPGQHSWQRMYPGARHHEAARLWAIKEGITKSFGDASWPDLVRMREMGIPMVLSRALNQARHDRNGDGR